jgi:hypothetical protein
MSDLDELTEEPQRTVPLVFHQGESRNVVSGLFDIKFHRVNAVRMAPLVYCLVMAISALACVYLTVLAFRYSTRIGLLCLFVIAPVAFLGVLVLTRFVLEFLLSLLVLPAYLNQLSNSVLLILETTTDIVGTTTDISGDTSGLSVVLPFGRLRRVLRGAMQDSLRKGAVGAPQPAASTTAGRAVQKAAQKGADRAAQQAAAQEAAERAIEQAIQEAADRAVQQTLEKAAERVARLAVEKATRQALREEAEGSVQPATQQVAQKSAETPDQREAVETMIRPAAEQQVPGKPEKS